MLIESLQTGDNATLSASEVKSNLRAKIINKRKEMNPNTLTSLSEQLCEHALMLDDVHEAKTVALYVARPHEPNTELLLRVFNMRGVMVLLPVLGDGLKRGWAPFTSMKDLQAKLPGRPMEPTSPDLGEDIINEADVILAPAVAISSKTGARLGHGGGWYDRILLNKKPSAKCIALVFDDEVFDDDYSIPVQEHDILIDAFVTPSGFNWIQK